MSCIGTRARGTASLVLFMVLVLVQPRLNARSALTADSAESQAIRYLAREVPLWPEENHCFSCHNNGDAVRALYAATHDPALGRLIPTESLRATNRWLTGPKAWDQNGGDGPFSDKRLARLQFTAAQAEAIEAGQPIERTRLIDAADRLVLDQSASGAFLLDGGDSLGSPATYGRPLATRILRDTLNAADHDRFREAVRRADHWLESQKVESLLDAAAVLPCESRRAECLTLIEQGQGSDGGWGPFARSPSEVFDTAIVLLALDRFVRSEADRGRKATSLEKRIARGRSYLVESQQTDGSSRETTRPAGAETYAQRLSTTGWATLALLATRPG